MSHYSYLCGYIILQANNDQAKKEAVVDALREISALPATSEEDDWPFLTSSMFSHTKSPEYRDAVIHFAASYKDILGSWHEWSMKFEFLLLRLPLEEAKVIVQDEYLGDFVATWRSGSLSRTKSLHYVEACEIPAGMGLTNLSSQW
jgi:hypothetical protein